MFELTNHTYTVETTRAWNNNQASTQLEAVFGLPENSLVFGNTLCQKYNTSGAGYYCAHGLYMDGGGITYGEGHMVYGSSNSQQYPSFLAPNFAGVGYHYWHVTETSYGTSVFQNVYFNLLIKG